MFNRNIHNRLQLDNNDQENLKKLVAFFVSILALIVWSFILPTPIYFLFCGISVIGTIALNVIPELDDKLGRVGDWLTSNWPQLMEGNAEIPRQELISPPINHSLIHRRLSEYSIDSSATEEDIAASEYDESSVYYGQLFSELLLDTDELTQPSIPFNRVIRNSMLLI